MIFFVDERLYDTWNSVDIGVGKRTRDSEQCALSIRGVFHSALPVTKYPHGEKLLGGYDHDRRTKQM